MSRFKVSLVIKFTLQLVAKKGDAENPKKSRLINKNKFYENKDQQSPNTNTLLAKGYLYYSTLFRE